MSSELTESFLSWRNSLVWRPKIEFVDALAADWANGRSPTLPTTGPAWKAKAHVKALKLLSAHPPPSPQETTRPDRSDRRFEATQSPTRLAPAPPTSRGRRWSEDEVLCLYWVLPLMRLMARITGRDFSAIAMKLGNLLSVETEGQQGLANASRLDRAVVLRYRDRRAELEREVVRILAVGGPRSEADWADAIRYVAGKVLQAF